jgi:hypothetical protein
VFLGVGGLAVVFSRAADRYRHEVSIGVGNDRRVILSSFEGSANDIWPRSPPFQELHVQGRGNEAETALLVGRAGRSHWSASVELDGARQALMFDVACRCSGPIDWLGTSYKCIAENPTLADNDRTLLLPFDCQVQVLEGEFAASLTGDAHVFSIVPRRTASRAAQTVRWKYLIMGCQHQRDESRSSPAGDR